MATVYMPASGERGAPKFDKTKPRELTRFFSEYERCLVRVGITSEKEKKEELLRYVDFDIEQIWKRFPSYADGLMTYADFKDAILGYYPDPTGDYLYSLRDLDTLISNCQRDGINSADELQAYHLAYTDLTTWLIDKDHMGDFEQRSRYMQAFRQPLLGQIIHRLQMQYLDQHPNKPHTIAQVREAARFLLQSSASMAPVYIPPVVSTSVKPSSTNEPTVPGVITVKTETFASVMAEFTKTIVDTLNQSNRSRITGPTGSTSRNTNCNFCGGDHFIRDCKVVDEYITAGKCRRNFEGRVTLSTGAFVPRDIPGTLLCERVNEWHRRNPNQLSAATLIHTISTEHIRANSGAVSTSSFQLSTADRITALEAELFNLRAKKSTFVPVVRTRAQRARELPFGASIEEVDDVPVAPVRETTPMVRDVSAQPPAVAPKPAIIITAPQPEEPVHPFSLAKDAAYAPPNVRNVGALPKVPSAKAATPAYKTLPPIHDPAIAIEVYQRAMDSMVSVSQRELLSLSPELRAKVRDCTTTRRIPNTPVTQTSLQVINDEEEEMYEITPAFTLGNRTPPKGATIVPDPIESYYKSLEPGEIPDLNLLTVAKESTAIRSINALIDTTMKKECTVDPGCQVIAMSEATCHSLSLAYDPRIRLNMESANGSFDWSLGLARNVPFLIGTITLYLQVHVIRSPSYEILLGRPFDVLTESVVRNFTNEDQTITITDPNTGKQCTIPTFARGHKCNHNHGPPDF